MDTIIFGNPTGSSRIAGVMSAVPPDPPSPMIPATSRSARKLRKANDISVIAVPRSPVKTASAPAGWQAATCSAGKSTTSALAPLVDTSTVATGCPRATRPAT